MQYYLEENEKEEWRLEELLRKIGEWWKNGANIRIQKVIYRKKVGASYTNVDTSGSL